MMSQKVSISDGEWFFIDELNSDSTQSILRKKYLDDSENLARCHCNESEDLKLVIAYRRKTGKFELRKHPSQHFSLHQPDCRFHKEPVAKQLGGGKGFSLSIPNEEHTHIPDHDNAKNILNSLWKTLSKKIGDVQECDKIPWYELKDNLIEIMESIILNGRPMAEGAILLKPVPKDERKPIEVPPGKSAPLVSEIFSAREVQNGSVVLELKGTTDTVWLNKFWNQGLSERQRDLLLNHDKNDGRLISLLVIKRSDSGKSIQAYSAAFILVDTDSFKRIK
ncbi:MAG: hypothetical protein IE914_05195 [Thiotrichales bacterium]|nr:hypothetical protein [Thiotrichales bacterium]